MNEGEVLEVVSPAKLAETSQAGIIKLDRNGRLFMQIAKWRKCWARESQA